MQSNDTVRKIILEVNGDELTDLVRFGEIFVEDIPVEVPSLKRIVTILAGVNKINPIACSFKLQRNGLTKNLLQTWVEDKKIKDITVIEVDGSGVENGRMLLKDCEAGNLKFPEYDASSPIYSQAEITFYPFDVLTLE